MSAKARLSQKSARAIVARVAASHGLHARDLLERSLFPHIAHARFEAYAAVRDETGSSSLQIGAFFGRDHTTILHGIRAHRARVSA